MAAEINNPFVTTPECADCPFAEAFISGTRDVAENASQTDGIKYLPITATCQRVTPGITKKIFGLEIRKFVLFIQPQHEDTKLFPPSPLMGFGKFARFTCPKDLRAGSIMINKPQYYRWQFPSGR